MEAFFTDIGCRRNYEQSYLMPATGLVEGTLLYPNGLSLSLSLQFIYCKINHCHTLQNFYYYHKQQTIPRA